MEDSDIRVERTVAWQNHNGGSFVIAHEWGTEPLDVKLLTFNPYHLRVIAASRKKTDKRDAYWLAKTVQSGMTPHPVYIPTGIVRQLRALLNERDTVTGQRKAGCVGSRLRAWMAEPVSHQLPNAG